MKRKNINYTFDIQRIWPNSLVFYLVANHHLNVAYPCGGTRLISEHIRFSDTVFLGSLPNQTFWKAECLSGMCKAGEINYVPVGDLNISMAFLF